MTTSGQPAQDYPAVKDSHVTPRMYLKAWTDAGNLAEVHAIKLPPGAPVGTKLRPRRIGVKGIAVREYFYARERPSGELFHDVEWSLGQAEGAVAPLLTDLRSRWPLIEEDKAAVAEFIALQLVRGPKEFDRLNQVSENAVDEFVARTDHSPGPGVVDGRLTEESIAAQYAFVRDKTRQMKRMLRHERIGAVMIGSMQWTLVEFDEPLLVTSDHPVHLWPLGKSSMRPRASASVTPGVRDTLEVKWPISPNVALLATWRDLGDAREPLKGTEPLASSLNGLLIAQAEEQWLQLPESSPPYRSATDVVMPWSGRLFPGYTPKTAAQSYRLRKATELVKPMLAQEGPAETFSIVYMPSKSKVGRGRGRAPRSPRHRAGPSRQRAMDRRCPARPGTLTTSRRCQELQPEAFSEGLRCRTTRCASTRLYFLGCSAPRTER